MQHLTEVNLSGPQVCRYDYSHKKEFEQLHYSSEIWLGGPLFEKGLKSRGDATLEQVLKHGARMRIVPRVWGPRVCGPRACACAGALRMSLTSSSATLVDSCTHMLHSLTFTFEHHPGPLGTARAAL